MASELALVVETLPSRSCMQVSWSSFPNQIKTDYLERQKGWFSTAAADSGRRLRVVLARRPGSPRRSVLNAEEVMKWCNAWKPGAEAGGDALAAVPSGRLLRRRVLQGASEDGIVPLLRAEGGNRGLETASRGAVVGARCVSYDFEDLPLSAALMAQTDVLLGVHGAALMNAAFMPKHAAAIEIKPLGFTGRWPDHYLRRVLTEIDKNQSVQWWGYNGVKESNSAPGRQEKEGVGKEYMWRRDRHVRLETDVLQTLFDRIAWVGGETARYLELAAGWGHYLNDDGSRPSDKDP